MTKYLTQIKNPADANDPYLIKDLEPEIRGGKVVGKLYRDNVGGSGNFSISGNSGIIPNLTAGHYTVYIYAKSTTQSYTFRFNFGTDITYDLSTTNGILSDTRAIAISGGTFSGSVIAPAGGVDSGTILYVVMYNTSSIIPIKTVGPAAVTNSYTDLNDKPSSMTPSSHTHGNIQNGGTLQSNDITIANGDKLVVTDYSDSNKIARTSLSFDGSTTNQFLSKKGTWETPTGGTDTLVNQSINSANSGNYPLLFTSVSGGPASGTSAVASEVTYIPNVRWENNSICIGDLSIFSPQANKHITQISPTVISHFDTDDSNNVSGIAFGDTSGSGNPTLSIIDSTFSTVVDINASGITAPQVTVSGLADNNNTARMVTVDGSGILGAQTIPTNTDTHVNVTLNRTTKGYLLATSTTPTGTATPNEAISDDGVYLDTISGRLTTSSLKISGLGGSGNKMVIVNNAGVLSHQDIPSTTDTHQQIDVAVEFKGKEAKSFLITGVEMPYKNGGCDWDNFTWNYPYTGLANNGGSGIESEVAVWVYNEDLGNNHFTTRLNTPKLRITNIDTGTPVTNGYLALDSNYNVIKTGVASSSLTGNIPLTWLGTTSTTAAYGDHTHRLDVKSLTLSTSATTLNPTYTANGVYNKSTISANTGAMSFQSSTSGDMFYMFIENSNASNTYNIVFNSSYKGGGTYKILPSTRMEFSILYDGSTYIITYTTLKS